MRKFVFTLMLLAGAAGIAAQTTTLLAENRSWANLYCGVGAYFKISLASTDLDMLSGDTIIAGNTYKKLLKVDQTTNNVIGLQGFMREANRQVMFRYPNSENEFMLYDFSLNVGQEFALDYGYSGGELWFKVMAVDSININNSLRKRMFIAYNISDPSIDDVWIEGIGSTNGLLSPCYDLFSCGSQRRLLCHYENQELVYQDSILTECYYDDSDSTLLTSVFYGTSGLDEPTETALYIYPNPASDAITIYTDYEESDVEIVGYDGRRVGRYALSAGENRISVSNLPSGTYFVRLINNKKIVSKFLKL